MIIRRINLTHLLVINIISNTVNLNTMIEFICIKNGVDKCINMRVAHVEDLHQIKLKLTHT